jgi:hypothetical protein
LNPGSRAVRIGREALRCPCPALCSLELAILRRSGRDQLVEQARRRPRDLLHGTIERGLVGV